jgi:hypothetical protein
LVLGVLLAALVMWPGMAPADEADSTAAGWRGGFGQPVSVIPEIGLWADALSELGYGARPGLLVWWGFGPVSGDSEAAGAALDWSKYTFRIRVEILDAIGKRVAKAEELIDPLERVDLTARGGFPTADHLVIDKPGEYRARLEAYPLIDAEEAGLDSVPRGIAEVDVRIARRSRTDGDDWLISDLLFLDAIENWLPGSHSERTWYEWVVYPNVPRSFLPDSSGAMVAFEIERGDELVPRCVLRSCRVVISVLDAEGGIVQQAMRQVPDEGSVSAYVVPFQTIDLEPGSYDAQVEVYEAGNRILTVSRSFGVREGATASPRDSRAEGQDEQ